MMQSSILLCILAVISQAQHTLCNPVKSSKDQQVNASLESLLPTEEEVHKMPLSDLVAQRPKGGSRQKAKHKFQELFAKHPRVAALDATKLDMTQLAQGWTSLRKELKGKVQPAKVHVTIQHHLEHVSKLDTARIEEINGHWSAHNYRDTDLRSEKLKRAKFTPSVLRALDREKTERRRDVKMQADPVPSFEELMAEYKIPSGLNAFELERKSLIFTDRYPSKIMSTVDLRRYLQDKGYKQGEIDAAVGLRRRYSKRKNARSFNASRRKRQKEEKARKEAASTSALIKDAPESMTDGGHHHYLNPSLSWIKKTKKLQSDWWKTSNL